MHQPTQQPQNQRSSQLLSSDPALSERMQVKYLVSGGSHCPRCESEEIGSTDAIEAGGVSSTGQAEASQEISCRDCGLRWRDVYRLIAIELIEIEVGSNENVAEEGDGETEVAEDWLECDYDDCTRHFLEGSGEYVISNQGGVFCSRSHMLKAGEDAEMAML